MLRRFLLLATAVLIGAAVPAAAQEKPRYGGELVFVVPSSPPSYDAHREETFGTIHPIAPHYNTRLRTDPSDKLALKVVPDLTESWTVSKNGRTYIQERLQMLEELASRLRPPSGQRPQ